jgi:hypothetical protein
MTNSTQTKNYSFSLYLAQWRLLRAIEHAKKAQNIIHYFNLDSKYNSK